VALTITLATPVVNSTSASVTTASFTPTASSTLVVLASGGRTAAGAATVAVTDSLSGTWTAGPSANSTQNASSGAVAAIAYRTVTASAMTVTVTTSGGTPNGAGAVVLQVVAAGTLQFGATGVGSGAAASITPTIFTSTVSGSTAVVSGAEWSGGSTMSSSDLTGGFFSNANQEGGGGTKTLGATGSQTANLQISPSAGNIWVWAALELLDVASGPAGAPYKPSYGRLNGRGPQALRFLRHFVQQALPGQDADQPPVPTIAGMLARPNPLTAAPPAIFLMSVPPPEPDPWPALVGQRDRTVTQVPTPVLTRSLPDLTTLNPAPVAPLPGRWPIPPALAVVLQVRDTTPLQPSDSPPAVLVPPVLQRPAVPAVAALVRLTLDPQQDAVPVALVAPARFPAAPAPRPVLVGAGPVETVAALEPLVVRVVPPPGPAALAAVVRSMTDPPLDVLPLPVTVRGVVLAYSAPSAVVLVVRDVTPLQVSSNPPTLNVTPVGWVRPPLGGTVVLRSTDDPRDVGLKLNVTRVGVVLAIPAALPGVVLQVRDFTGLQLSDSPPEPLVAPAEWVAPRPVAAVLARGSGDPDAHAPGVLVVPLQTLPAPSPRALVVQSLAEDVPQPQPLVVQVASLVATRAVAGYVTASPPADGGVPARLVVARALAPTAPGARPLVSGAAPDLTIFQPPNHPVSVIPGWVPSPRFRVVLLRSSRADILAVFIAVTGTTGGGGLVGITAGVSLAGSTAGAGVLGSTGGAALGGSTSGPAITGTVT